MRERSGPAYARYLFGPHHQRSASVQAAARFLRRADVRFPLGFAALGLGAWLLYATFEESFALAARTTAAVVERLADLLGLEATAHDDGRMSFGGGTFSYDLTLGCTALYVGMLFASAILAYPARWPQRAIGLVVGLPALFVVNVARLVSMGWLGLRFPGSVEEAHVFWWQAALILLVGIGWLAWLRFVVEMDWSASKARALRELATAVAVFVATLSLLALLAAPTRAPEAYGRLVSAAAATLMGGIRGREDATDLFTDDVLYAALAATVAFFLATPRVSATHRLRGAMTWGAAAAIVVGILGKAVDHWSTRPGTAASALSYAAAMILPLAAWYAWASRRRVFAPPEGGPPQLACPACGRRSSDVMTHVRTVHKRERRRLTRDLFRDHPTLADATRGPKAARGKDHARSDRHA